MKKVLGMFLAAAALGTALLTILPATQARAEVVLSYANFPPAITFPCVQMERWAEEVEKRTNGAVVVETYPGGTLLGAKDMFDGVKDGQADIGCTSMAYFPGAFPLTSVLEVPVGFSSSTVPSLVLWDLYEKHNPEAFADFKVLTMFTTAPSNLMATQPVRTLADLQGLEIRASGGASRVLEMLGAVPVSKPMSETPDALQKGLVQGLLSSLEVLKDFNFAETCRYETVTNFQVYPFAVVMNRDVWDSLDPEVQQVLEELGREQCLWTGQYMDEHVVESLAWSKETYDIEVIEWPEADMAQALETLSPMIDEWKAAASEAGLDAEALFAEMMDLKAKYEAEYGE
ncbi:MAG: C4-dicarboxylate ABC transporter substrate-binding protein [Desulfovibrio sp.]|nr:MAG: C4-dicarboxylate ABC transporter substrate-binding protein [Desulfovibrio sp.]